MADREQVSSSANLEGYDQQSSSPSDLSDICGPPHDCGYAEKSRTEALYIDHHWIRYSACYQCVSALVDNYNGPWKNASCPEKLGLGSAAVPPFCYSEGRGNFTQYCAPERCCQGLDKGVYVKVLALTKF